MATADLTPSQDRQLTDRDRYPIPFKVFDFLRNELGMEDLTEIAKVFEALEYSVSTDALQRGNLEVSKQPEDGSARSPHLIILNK